MNFEDAEELENEASKLISKEVRVLKRDFKGEKKVKVFTFKNIRGIGLETKIRDKGTESDSDKMFYQLSAVLEEKSGNEIIDTIPLKEVVNAIQKEAIINYTKW